MAYCCCSPRGPQSEAFSVCFHNWGCTGRRRQPITGSTVNLLTAASTQSLATPNLQQISAQHLKAASSPPVLLRCKKQPFTSKFQSPATTIADRSHPVLLQRKATLSPGVLLRYKQRISSLQNFLKVLSKSSKEYENSLKNEYNKFQAACQKFTNEKAAHLQTFKDIFSNYEADKEKLVTRYEQMRKKEKSALAELEKAFTNKIMSAEEALKKKKQDDKSLSLLRKSLGSFLSDASDDD